MTRGRSIEYSADELAWIRANHALPEQEFADRFNHEFGRSEDKNNLVAKRQRMGLRTGRTGCFEKGTIPPNKGRKGMPSHPNMVPTQFKKGQRSRNYKGPGHEYIDNKDGYVWLIVAGPSPYKTSTSQTCHPVMKHRHLWEQKYGPIAKGHVLKCLGGDKTNCDPSNWTLIPQALLPRLAGGNRYRNIVPYDEAPSELKPAILAAAKLEHEAALLRRRMGRLIAGERYRERQKQKRAAQ